MKITSIYQKFHTPKGLSNKYSIVDDYLIRGPHPNINQLLALKKMGVTQIYDFRHVGVRGFKFVEKYLCRELGIEYKRYPFSYLNKQLPGLDNFEEIAKSVKLNGQQGGKALFHCNSGSHRTAHMAAFYELTKGEPLKKVMNENIVQFADRLNSVLERHFYQKKYFNRNYLDEKTLNPVKYFRNKFNNRVKQATELAHASFLSIITGYKS